MQSAYLFEDSYGRVREDFEEGTDNICLQILNGNLLRKTSTAPHSCYNLGYPKMRVTNRKDDRWFYTYKVFDDQPVYKFYLLEEGKV